MIAVIFEVTPAAGQKEAYLDIAAGLKPMLEQVDGFISVERFQSITAPTKMLSLSFFRDEEALVNLRALSEKRREQAPADSNAAHGCPYRP